MQNPQAWLSGEAIPAPQPLRRKDIFNDSAPSEKATLRGTHRVRALEETEAIAWSLASRIGLTRLSDITGLDRTGIPVYCASLPCAEEGNLTINSGKGLTKRAARVSAMMEAVERYCGERRNRVGVFATYGVARDQAPAIDPFDFTLSEDHTYGPQAVLEWWPAYDLANDDVALVPAAAVLQPYRFEPYLFASSSNGLASGNTLAEAVLHGLYEVVERHAASLAYAGGPIWRIEKSSIDDAACAELLGKFAGATLDVHVHRLSRPGDVPVFQVIVDDPVRRDRKYINAGFGCHLSAPVALCRALCEAAQSRTLVISGARDDLAEEIGAGLPYENHRAHFARWFDKDGEQAFRYGLPNEACESNTVEQELALMTHLLVSSGYKAIYVVDLTINVEDVKVVRVMVPGLETTYIERNRRVRGNL